MMIITIAITTIISSIVVQLHPSSLGIRGWGFESGGIYAIELQFFLINLAHKNMTRTITIKIVYRLENVQNDG